MDWIQRNTLVEIVSQSFAVETVDNPAQFAVSYIVSEIGDEFHYSETCIKRTPSGNAVVSA